MHTNKIYNPLQHRNKIYNPLLKEDLNPICRNITYTIDQSSSSRIEEIGLHWQVGDVACVEELLWLRDVWCAELWEEEAIWTQTKRVKRVKEEMY